MNKTIIYQELIKNQRKNINNDKKLSLSDLKRISTYLSNSIFTNNCSLWEGYVGFNKIKETESNTEIIKIKDYNNAFVNFFFNGKKQALHRILYNNFINNINENEYLKFTCENKGKCCSINHIVLLKEKIENKIENKIDESIIIENIKDKKNIIVNFN